MLSDGSLKGPERPRMESHGGKRGTGPSELGGRWAYLLDDPRCAWTVAVASGSMGTPLAHAPAAASVRVKMTLRDLQTGRKSGWYTAKKEKVASV